MEAWEKGRTAKQGRNEAHSAPLLAQAAAGMALPPWRLQETKETPFWVLTWEKAVLSAACDTRLKYTSGMHAIG